MIPRSKLSHASMAKLLLSVACSVRPGSSSMVNRFGATIVSTWLTDGFLPVPGRSRRARACPLMGWPGRVQRLLCWTTVGGRYAKLKEHEMRTSQQSLDTVSTIGIDVGKNTFHLVGFDPRGAIVLQQKLTRHQLGCRLSNIPRCLIGMETCSGTHFIARQLTALGHDVRLIPAQYVKPFLKGHKNDYRDAEAIAEAVQRPTMHFVSIKTPEQMDLLALHRVRSRLVRQRTGVANQIRGFLLERGITVRQGFMPLRKALPDILSSKSDALSPRMINLIGELVQDWRRL